MLRRTLIFKYFTPIYNTELFYSGRFASFVEKEQINAPQDASIYSSKNVLDIYCLIHYNNVKLTIAYIIEKFRMRA